MKHEEALGRMDEYLAGGLSGEETAAVDSHLRECEFCRSAARAWDRGAPVPALDVQVVARLRRQKRRDLL